MNRCAEFTSRLATARTTPSSLREIARQFFLAIPAVDKNPQRIFSERIGNFVICIPVYSIEKLQNQPCSLHSTANDLHHSSDRNTPPSVRNPYALDAPAGILEGQVTFAVPQKRHR
jgi:hypothetical protein